MDTAVANGIKDFLLALKRANDYSADIRGMKFCKDDVFSIAKGGRKYAKVQVQRRGDRFSTSVVCFIDKATGDIWKAASWKAPALNFTRGNVLDLKGTLRTFDVWHGAAWAPQSIDMALADIGQA